MERGNSYSSVGSQNSQITNYKSLTLFPSLWHSGCHPNRFSKTRIKLAKIARVPRENLLEIFEEKHDNAASHNRLYQVSMKVRHEGQVNERKFQVGKLVWKTVPHVRGVAGAIRYNFSPKWEGPYIVEEAHQTRHY